MTTLKDENYYSVQAWMVTRLGLSGNKLNVYAIIYGFSQDGKSEFDGGTDYLVQFTGASRRSIINILQELTEAGLLVKRSVMKGGVSYSSYVACTSAKTAPVQESHQCKNDAEVVQKLHSGSAETAPNNIYKKNNKDNPPYIPPKVEYQPFDDLINRNVAEQVASDWLKHRKTKRSSVTKTAIDGIAREAAKAGISLNDALKICCERGWQGFNADWLNETRGIRNEESKRTLDQLTGRDRRMYDDGRTIDAEASFL